MDSLDFSRSKALNNIPQKKLLDILSSIENSNDDLNVKSIKMTAINRYAESNIPIEYWSLKMEKDFKGDQRLLNKYNEYVSDLKSSYINGSSVCFAGGHGLGKMLSLNTDIPTPNGFVKLIDLKEGDQLFDEKGNICNIIKLHPIDLNPESYEITFDDNSKVHACADHLWLTHTIENQPSVKSTKDILKTLLFNKKYNHSIKCSNPLNYPHKNLPIDPYLLGLWLSDGNPNNDLIDIVDLKLLENYSYHILPSCICHKSVSVRVDGLFSALKNNNLLNNKHIPNDYLYSSYEERLSLLQGLLETEAFSNNKVIEYYSTDESVCQLIRSLGIKLNQNGSKITFSTNLPVFKRKLNELKNEDCRFITSIKPIPSEPMRCITVDSPSNLFLITKSFIPTHNTMTVSCILKKASQKGYSCLYSTLGDIVHVITQGLGEDKYLSRRELVLVDFLVIDEFDSRFMPSENAADLYARSLESVFRTRSQNKLPTLMCTNSPNIVESFNGSLKQSIDSLIKGYLKIFPVFGEDFRKKR